MKKYILPILVICLSVAGLVQLFKYLGSKEVQPVPAKQADRVVTRSEAECREFFSKNVETLLKSITSGKTSYPEINTRFTSAKLNQLSINLVTSYHWASKDIEGSAGKSSDGTPLIEIYVPAVMDAFEILKHAQMTHWHEAFESHIIVMFMHEMEHLRFDKKKADHIDINEESRTWSETCRHIIAPLAEQKIPLLGNDAVLYVAWRDSLGNTGDPIWIEAIKHLYGDLDGKVEPKTTRK